MFLEGLSNYLAKNPGIVAQLGTARGDKSNGVFPQLAPDGPTFPYITYMQISGEPEESMQGMNRLTTARIRLSSYGSSYGAAKRLAEAVRQAFGLVSQYQGALSDGTILQNARQILPGEVDDTESVPHGMIYSTHMDYEFMYTNIS